MKIPNIYSEIPRLTITQLRIAARVSGMEHISDFSPDGDKQESKISWPKVSRAVLARDNYSCRICGQSSLKPYSPAGRRSAVHLDVQVHHIIPRKDSGSDSFLNLVTLCEQCHRKTFKIGYAGLPQAERSLDDFVSGIGFCVPAEYADTRSNMGHCRLIDYDRAYIPESGKYEIIEVEGSFLDVISISLGMPEIQESARYFENAYGAKSYMTVRAEGTRSGSIRVFTDASGRPIL